MAFTFCSTCRCLEMGFFLYLAAFPSRRGGHVRRGNLDSKNGFHLPSCFFKNFYRKFQTV